MPKNESMVDKKVTAHIEHLFAGIGPSQQLFDLKEELATNLKEKIGDYKARGMDDEQSFKEAVISLGDLSGLVDDMRKIGRDSARINVYTSMSTRISTAGIIAAVLLILFGILTIAMLYFMRLPGEAVTGSGIFVVAGGALLTYSVLTRETTARYAMNKVRAVFYALSIGIILFSLFTAVITRYATGEIYISIGSFMVFFLVGIGLFLFLILTGTGHRKKIY